MVGLGVLLRTGRTILLLLAVTHLVEPGVLLRTGSMAGRVIALPPPGGDAL